MKSGMVITMSILAGALYVGPIAFSQSPTATASGKNWKQKASGRLANLSHEERVKLKNARQQAMQDPQVQAARDKMKQAGKEFRDAMEAALLKADPSVKPILDKMPKSEGPQP